MESQLTHIDRLAHSQSRIGVVLVKPDGVAISKLDGVANKNLKGLAIKKTEWPSHRKRSRRTNESGFVPLSPRGRGVRGEGEFAVTLERAKRLRKEMTDAEKFVWSKLRGHRFAYYKWKRQVPLCGYVVDFVCFGEKLILELDGSQHAERKDYDDNRTKRFEQDGFRVMRFWNHEALNDWDMVADNLWLALQNSPSPPTPLPPGERGAKTNALSINPTAVLPLSQSASPKSNQTKD